MFGPSLVERLAPSARYLVPDFQGEKKKWKRVALDEYRQTKGLKQHNLPQKGAVELMASRAPFGYRSDGGYTLENHFLPPAFCQPASAALPPTPPASPSPPPCPLPRPGHIQLSSQIYWSFPCPGPLKVTRNHWFHAAATWNHSASLKMN